MLLLIPSTTVVAAAAAAACPPTGKSSSNEDKKASLGDTNIVQQRDESDLPDSLTVADRAPATKIGGASGDQPLQKGMSAQERGDTG